MLGRLQLNKLQKWKVAVHVFQALFIFIGLCILIAVLTRGGHNDGRVFFYLALCFLSIPALIYLVMTPMWGRAVRFANAFAMVGVDVVYTIFWFSALIALAAYNNNGKDQGAKDKKVGEGNCTVFAFGPPKKCELANAAVGLGVVVFLLWLATSAISIYFLLRWRKGGDLPWEQAAPKTYHEPISIEAHTKDAWSSDVHEPADQGSDDGRTTSATGGGYGDDESMLLHGTDTENGRHPGTPWDPLSTNQGYAPAMPEELDYRNGHHYGEPTALSPHANSPHGGGYDSHQPHSYQPDAYQPDSYQPGNPVFNSSGRS